MKIWLDDLRDPKDYGHDDAIWFKNSDQFIEFLEDPNKMYRRVTEWHFDNDLGEDSKEGYRCLEMLEEKLVFGKPILYPAVLFVHTSNPSAAQKFMAAKEVFKRYGIEILRNNY
ncbi:hypothetical protein A73_208 [Escherichia phage A73]|uniref:Cyclic-phosphate processing Receiver domain-containing protein n=1 Tax=Escherichia phage A73 TaxID=3003819 RepID=A0AAE9W5A9_9CAUD|nr:hypothetical protein A73_208 [Escherichia phage A73]WBF77998.1 hypothetical protein W70_193 [Escherichia phage W70]